ncbi:MAG: acetyl-CoA C-acyltransferase [Candidatus Marinimicrobia bacterium]|nr:acetyl-CoA C-acyltransferase [Candidatus Neomarinimicrobiota bacterium]
MNNTFICAYKRTPIGAFQGSLSNIAATKLGSIIIKSVLKQAMIDKDKIDEVIMGNVLSANLGQAPARQAVLGADLSNKVECTTINKVCGSGLKSVMLADQSIRLSNAKISIAGGMENMSLAPYYLDKSRTGMGFGNQAAIDSILKDGLWDPYNNFAMGNCGEVLCKEENYSRQDQDDYAIESYERSNRAIKNGEFKDEIEPVLIKNRRQDIIFDTDEEPLKFRKDKISKLRPAFSKDGTITAANASSLSDGSAAVLLASENEIDRHRLKPLAKIIAHCSFAGEPLYFTRSPIHAIEKVLNLSGLKLNDIDLFEINEAFSCVPMIAIDTLKISSNKVNVNGGAVSMGHPIGASGTRILVTLLNTLKNRKLKYGLAAICIGGGEASAMIVENYDL